MIYKDHLAFHGLPNGLSGGGVRGQAAKQELVKPHWVEVANDSATADQRQIWQRLKAQVSTTLPSLRSAGRVGTGHLEVPKNGAPASSTTPPSRKRSAAAMQTPPDDDLDNDYTPATGTSKRKRMETLEAADPASSSRATVMIPVTPKKTRRGQVQLSTPRSRSIIPRKDLPKFDRRRKDGTILHLTEKECAVFDSDLIPVQASAAFPRPAPELLFR